MSITKRIQTVAWEEFFHVQMLLKIKVLAWIDMRLSWLNHQSERLTTFQNISQKVDFKSMPHKEEVTMSPKVHYAKKHQIAEHR